VRFSEISPLAYRFAVWCFKARRRLAWLAWKPVASKKSAEDLPFEVASHATPILRALAGVDERLQRNKAVNLGIAGPCIDGILIPPGKQFSFWRLVGPNTKARGYLPGLVLRHGGTAEDYGGGICQLANSIHWLALQSELEVVERHHHSSDFFPDNLRRVPFGSGASVFYNYVDYRFRNPGEATFQLRVRVDDSRLTVRLLSDREPTLRFEVYEPLHRFVRYRGGYYRENVIARKAISRSDGALVEDRELYHHFSKVLYGPEYLPSFEVVDEMPDLSPGAYLRDASRHG
jgi:vancomycin resistance protein VanW